uniref:Uncharacterized protein n=1 Tax=Trichobilharzia regenti TaxID=157069 RepID=A0AA85JLF0_TRIRE|nr:unnamed protein product [Trichobilharzia regenti]
MVKLIAEWASLNLPRMFIVSISSFITRNVSFIYRQQKSKSLITPFRGRFSNLARKNSARIRPDEEPMATTSTCL